LSYGIVLPAIQYWFALGLQIFESKNDPEQAPTPLDICRHIDHKRARPRRRDFPDRIAASPEQNFVAGAAPRPFHAIRGDFSMTSANPNTVPERDMANAIRFLSADAVQNANSGHPGMPMGMADAATVLFNRFLKFDAAAPKWRDRDRFVLSAGHGSMLIYSLLCLCGYEDMTLDDIRDFRKIGSRAAGHPEYGHSAGIEATTGPLGQGIAMAVGMALAERMQSARFGDDAVDHFTYVISGDGCLMEGISHEAVSLAGTLGLSKLILLWDDNAISIDGPTEQTRGDDQLARFRAMGWDTQSVDGHDHEAVASAIAAARKTDTPSIIGCKTVIGFGAPSKEGTAATHGAPLGDEELKGARERLGWPHAPFQVPDGILAAWRATGSRGAEQRAAWEARTAAMDPALKAEFDRMGAGKLPADWQKSLHAFKGQLIAEQPKKATRQWSGSVLEVLTETIPELIGGSADLTGSVNTMTKSTVPVTPEDFSGRYIYYGVREHAMGAVMNGLALHDFIPYAGTFLGFSDYMAPAIRMSALMGIRVVYVLTHDSIGLGEDGPTHQPVEALPALRALPNLNVFRPADAVETVECWDLATTNRKTPSAMILTRQGVTPLRDFGADENMSARGAYVMAAAEGERKVTLLATGSEVGIAMEVRQALQEEGIGTTVVSMPCWELFELQDADYRKEILGPGTVRVGIEASVSLGWGSYLGDDGAFIGMRSFGASGPAPELFEHFGITWEKVVAAVKERL
jgi:transketolase